MRPVTFLSDYGHADEFAGVCRAVIARLAPGAPLIDLTHGIPAQDVRRGAFALAAALPFAPPGVHLAVVDPGVGTSRRAIAVAAGDGERTLVGPDNGLLWPALEALGGAQAAVELGASRFRLEPVSASFHGRDVFAPVAAALAAGEALEVVGEPIDPGTLARLATREPVIGSDHVAAHLAYFDGFGNAVLELPAAQLPERLFGPGDELVLEAGGEPRAAVFGRTFADAAEGGAVVYADATGMLAIAINRGSAAAVLGLRVDDQVLLRRAP